MTNPSLPEGEAGTDATPPCGKPHRISELTCQLPAGHGGAHLFFATERRCACCGQPKDWHVNPAAIVEAAESRIAQLESQLAAARAALDDANGELEALKAGPVTIRRCRDSHWHVVSGSGPDDFDIGDAIYDEAAARAEAERHNLAWNVSKAKLAAELAAARADREALLGALADVVAKATDYGTQEGGFVAFYLLPTGPVHRAIPLLQKHGIIVRPGFDGRVPVEVSPHPTQGDQ